MAHHLNDTQTYLPPDFVYLLKEVQNDSNHFGLSYEEVNMTKISRLNSPLAVTMAVLLVFLFSPMILIGNSLVLVAMYRFKRLRTPSNYLMTSLATSDLGIGMFMPVGMYLELGGARNLSGAYVCLLSYGVAITLCCVSVLVMVAIAVDRFTSLARPLRYANLITHSAIERYIAVFWIYSSLVGFTPLGYALIQGTNTRYVIFFYSIQKRLDSTIPIITIKKSFPFTGYYRMKF